MRLPVMPPVKPMLAKPITWDQFVAQKRYVQVEPKWDGFRSIVFRDGDEVELGSRNEKPLTRYFPELVAALRTELPGRCVLDGEIVTATASGLDFEALQQRIHPAASRIALLAERTPASFLVFDVLALADEDVTGRPFAERRALLAAILAQAHAPVHLTPATTDPELARRWFVELEAAGCDGVVAKPLRGAYLPDKRAMFKIKHVRTADCVLAGYRVHKSGPDLVGSLLLGLYGEDGTLASVGVIGAFPMAQRRELFTELQPLVTTDPAHPWLLQGEGAGDQTPTSAAASRWNSGKDLSFVALRPERVVEVRYDHMEGTRFRHTTQFLRWRPDRDPASCTFAQLERPTTGELARFVPGLVASV